jgi:hypothetical protein
VKLLNNQLTKVQQPHQLTEVPATIMENQQLLKQVYHPVSQVKYSTQLSDHAKFLLQRIQPIPQLVVKKPTTTTISKTTGDYCI